MLRKNYLSNVLNEKRILISVSHPFIIHMDYFIKDVCNLYFVMPFTLGGDLFRLIQEKGVLGEFLSKFYSAQMVLAIEYLHYCDVIYR